VDVTRAAAANVAGVFNSMVARGESRERAQRFALQCVVAMFSEDAEMLPRGLFSELLDECRSGESSYDLIGGLFRQMNNPKPARGGRFKNVRYFNGGVFQAIDPVDLVGDEIALLLKASAENWSKVQPPIFGTLFQSSMGKEERHAYSYGIIQSCVHWAWANSRGGTLKGDFSYTSDTVFSSFAWPQKPTLAHVRQIAAAAVTLRALRRKIMADHKWSLRDLYRTLDSPGQSSLRTAHETLDAAVRAAYGMKPKDDALAFLLALNADLADREASMRPVLGPGLPPAVKDSGPFITADCISAG
jgi:hypothetical protein